MTALTTTQAQWPAITRISGRAAAYDRLLQSPASETACVFWRLRIVETVASTMELVHEVGSEEPFQIEWLTETAGTPRRVLVDVAEAGIQGFTTLHREGSPGAARVALAFGLAGRVRVEEMLLRPNDVVQAEGVMLQEAFCAGPFRTAEAPAALAHARVVVPGRLRPVRLLPWALGASALLLGAMGGASAVLRQWENAVRPDDSASSRALFPAQLGHQPAPKPRWP